MDPVKINECFDMNEYKKRDNIVVNTNRFGYQQAKRIKKKAQAKNEIINTLDETG